MVAFATQEQIEQNRRAKAEQRERDWNATPLRGRVILLRAGNWLCRDCYSVNAECFTRCYNCDRPNLPQW